MKLINKIKYVLMFAIVASCVLSVGAADAKLPPKPTCTNVTKDIPVRYGGEEPYIAQNIDINCSVWHDYAKNVELIDGPKHGTLEPRWQGAGAWFYTPDVSYVGSDSFSYRVTDAYDRVSNVASVTFNIVRNKDKPTCLDLHYPSPYYRVYFTCLFDSTKDLHYEIVDQPSHSDGPLLVSDTGRYADYQPEPGFSGTDSFTFRQINGGEESNLATVKIDVPEPFPNKLPSCDDLNGNSSGQPIELTLSCVDQNRSQHLTYEIVDQPKHAAEPLTIDADTDRVVYRPVDGFDGTDTFTYKVSDGIDDSKLATVTITVAAKAPSCDSGGKSGQNCSGSNGSGPLTAPVSQPVSPVTLAVSKCAVPRLVGLSLKQAKTKLRKAHCAVGRVRTKGHYRKHSSKRLRVLKQSAKAGSSKPANYKVKLTLGATRKHRHAKS